ncbi:MAG: M14 family zinc carboxypeptidase, partial [bacterium]|nr:M14 family zinc carboxypeptidase [bacterium]
MKNTTITIIVIVLLGIGGYFIGKSFFGNKNVVSSPNETTQSTNTEPNVVVDKSKTVIGKSVEGRDITAYHFGLGSTTELLFVGGIHGGYEWNTALVAYQLMDYLKQNPGVVPGNVRVTVIPVLNPDGLSKVLSTTTEVFTAADVSTSKDLQVAGRFNAHTVDLNRNFDCDWQSVGKWQNKNVSGGNNAFSEP